jgi:hypothetical protein
MCRPTFGAANSLAPQSAASAVRINEFLADASPLLGSDFIELYNPGTLPADIVGYFLTDNSAGWPQRSPIRPLTFIAAGGFLSFKADNDLSQGPEHTAFRLSPVQGEIGFVSPALTLVDYVLYGPQRTDLSEGRPADDANAIVALLPTPGATNRQLDSDRDRDGMPDAWEIDHGLNPDNPADGALDSDGDGRANLAEYLAGTDPRNPNDASKTTRPPESLQTGRLINLSVLAPLAEGEVMTIGTAIGGAGTSGTKAIVVRAAGPALAQFGVNEALPDPRLALINQGSGLTVAANNDWAGDPALSAAFAQVGAFPYATADAKDAGISQPTLAATNYTMQISDGGAGSGAVIAELYDATPAASFTGTTPRLINVSVLKQIVAGTTLTAGFVIDGSGSKTLLVRAVGPTLGLPPFNISGVMTDPKLELFDNTTGAKINENNDWGGTTELSAGFASVGAFALANASTKDAALLVTVPPGQYSVQVSGADGTGGVVIVEIYDVP